MTTINDTIRKVNEYIDACEWDYNALRLRRCLTERSTRIRNCGFYIDHEAKLVEVAIQYRDTDDDGWYIDERHFLYPKRDVDLRNLTLAGLERRCQHRGDWTAPEFFEVIRRAGLNAEGDDAYLDVLWAAGRKLNIQMC